MKPKLAFCLLLFTTIAVTGCAPEMAVTTITPTASHTPFPSASPVPPTPTLTQTVTMTPPPTSPPTLQPDQAKAVIQALLQEPVDCSAPCFWGIIPGQTTLEEARQNLAHLGIRPQYTNTLNSKAYYDSRYTLDYGLSISPLLAIQDDFVQNLVVNITPELQQPNVPRGWLAYSPETLIARYGMPSQVGIAVDTGPRTFFAMAMYFDEYDLIVEYEGYGIIATDRRVCPLVEQFDNVRIWFGKNPEHPPGIAVPLEEATSLTMEEFAKLMVGNPREACFDLKSQAFP